MLNVKRTFFLTESEVEIIKKAHNIPRLTTEAPHFELEDGTIVNAEMYDGKVTYKTITK